MPMWVPCDCGEWWCTKHEAHVFECDCPALEDFGDVDPYTRETPDGPVLDRTPVPSPDSGV